MQGAYHWLQLHVWRPALAKFIALLTNTGDMNGMGAPVYAESSIS